jgi:hypothetical protein
MSVTVRRIVKAHDRKHAVNGDTGSVVGDKNDGLLLVLVRVVGVRLSKNDEDLAAKDANAG